MHVELILLSCRTNGVWEHMSSDRDGDLWVRTPKLSQLACSKPRETLYNENKADSENIHTWTHCWSPTTSMKRTRSFLWECKGTFCACGDLRSVPARSSGAASLPNSTPRVAHALLEKSKVATTKGSRHSGLLILNGMQNPPVSFIPPSSGQNGAVVKHCSRDRICKSQLY